MNLNDLNINDKAYIKNVRHSGIKKRRLYDLGFIDGEIVEKKFTSLFKDPSCYKIKNTLKNMVLDYTNRGNNGSTTNMIK